MNEFVTALVLKGRLEHTVNQDSPSTNRGRSTRLPTTGLARNKFRIAVIRLLTCRFGSESNIRCLRPAYQLTSSSHTSEENMPNIRKETDSLRIVIVGGGFAGVTLAERPQSPRCA